MKYRLGIIGVGVMGNAIIDRAISDGVLRPSEVMAFDIDSARLSSMRSKGMATATDVQNLLDSCAIVLLAVKPQHYAPILEQSDFSKVSTVISIMAGVKLDTIHKKINSACGLVRVMPNTPCLVGKGFCAMRFQNVLHADKQFIHDIFSSCGDTLEIEEEMFDAVTSVSGSGPAYVYMFLNGMIKGGVEGGLSYDEAKTMAVSTMVGAAELAKVSDESMDKLVDKVCSKGGTTIEAVTIFRQKGLEDIIAEGIKACRLRSKELSEKL